MMSDPLETSVLETEATNTFTDQLPGWAVAEVNKQLRRLFGRPYSIDKAMEVLGIISATGELPDTDAVEIAVMYAYYLEHHQKSPLAAELLLIYLNKISPGNYQPVQLNFDALNRRVLVKESTLRALPGFDGLVCANAAVILERAIQNRLDNADALHPSREASFTRPDGSVETVSPTLSPLKSGGSETIYFDYNITLPGDEKYPIKQALGTITVISKVTVTSVPNDEGTAWAVSVDSWENWGFDEGDFEWNTQSGNSDDAKTQPVAISLDDLVPSWFPGRKRLIKQIKLYYPDLEYQLSNFQVKDKYMHQVANKVVKLPDGSTYNPKTYEIFIESWSPTMSCQVKSDYALSSPD